MSNRNSPRPNQSARRKQSKAARRFLAKQKHTNPALVQQLIPKVAP